MTAPDGRRTLRAAYADLRPAADASQLENLEELRRLRADDPAAFDRVSPRLKLRLGFDELRRNDDTTPPAA